MTRVSEAEHDPFRKMRLILELRRSGITDNDLLNVIEKLPREHFVDPEFEEYAYDDVALPIACGQTISRPSDVATIIYSLELGKDRSCTILEIGTGSGYLTALMSRLARRINTVDRYRTLVEAAKKRFDALGLTNIISQCSDGALGWPASAPFDRIVATCALEEVPQVWLDQLKAGGMLIMPVGTNEDQRLMRYRKDKSGKISSDAVGLSNFLHLVEGAAKEL